MPGTPGKNKINSHVRVSDRTGMKAADKQNKIKSDQKRPSDDSTVHGNQSVKEAVNTNVVDTKSLVGESKRLPGQSEARNECCIPSKQMKRSVVPTRFSHSSNGSPKRGTPILKSTFGQSKSSASNTSNVSSHLQRSLPANRSHWDVPVGDRRVRHLSGLDALPIFAPLENISGLSSDQDQRSSNNSAISTATQSSQSLSSSRPGTTSSLPVSTSSGSNASNISPSVRRRRLPAYGSRWDVWGRAPQSSNNSKHRSPWDVSPISVPLTRVSGLSPTSEQQPSNNSAINTATATSPTFLFSPAVSSSQFLKEETTSHALTPVRKSPAVHDQKLRLTPPKSFHPYESVPPKKPLKRKHPAAQQFNESSNVSSNLPIASKTKPSSTDRISPMPIKQEKVDCAQRTRSGPSLNSDSELGQKLVGKKNDEPLTQMSRHSTPFRSPGPSAFRSPPKRRLVAEGIRIDAITHASVNASGSFSTTPSRMSSSAMASASSTVSAAPSSSINTNSPRSGYRRLSNSGRNYHCLPKKGYPPWSGTGPTTKSLSSTFSSYSTSSQDISSANITTASITTASSSKTGNALSINPLSNRSHDCLPRRGYAPRDGTKPPTTSLSQPTPRPTTSTTQASASAFTTISLPTSTTASPIADTAVPYFTHRRLSNMGRSYTYLGKRGYPPLNGTRSTLASLSQPISTSSTPQSQSPTSVSTTTSLSTSTAASSTVDTSLSRSAHRRVSNSGRSYPYLPKRRLCLASKPVSESQVVSNTSSNVASFCSPSNQRLTVSQSTISATSNSSTSSTGASYSVSSRISSSCSSGAPLKITLRRNKSDKTSSAQNSSGMTGRGTGLNVSTRSSTGINLRSLHNPSKFASMNVKPKPSIFRPLGKAKKQNTKTGDDKPLPGTSGLTDKGDNQKPGTSSMTDKGDKSDSEDGDCTVCFERPVNAALIPCGHLSMCYECAVKVKKRDRLCPLCRQPIKSVLRVYKS